MQPQRSAVVVGPGKAGGIANGPVAVIADRGAGRHMVDLQRRRLAAAIVETVGSEGLQEASVSHVCRRASMSRRTFYELFEDREACLLAGLEVAMKRLIDEVAAAYSGSGAWRERIRVALTVLLERFDAEPALARVCVIETLRAGPAVLEYRAWVLAALADAVDEGRPESTGGVLPLTAQGVVGGVLAVMHAHLIEQPATPLVGLVGPLMAMIIHPYLGSASAREEFATPVAEPAKTIDHLPKDPFSGLSIRLTYRTAKVLATIAASPGASNREVGDGAEISDDGQTSRLLSRLRAAGLVTNDRQPGARGERNAWSLTQRGRDVHTMISS